MRVWDVKIHAPDANGLSRVEIRFDRDDCPAFLTILPPDVIDHFRAVAPPGTVRGDAATLDNRTVLDAAADRAAGQFLGDQLFRTLLTDRSTAKDYGEKLLDALKGERSEGSRVALRLDLSEAGELSDLPWELMYATDPKVREYLATCDAFGLTRYRASHGFLPPAPATVPLRMLLVVADPTGKLDTVREVTNVRAAIGALAAGTVEMKELYRATRRDFALAVNTMRPHVVHYIGHGSFDGQTGRLHLHGQGAPDAVDHVDAQGLSTIMKTDRPWLIFLNACEGAVDGRAARFAGLAQELLGIGIPFVIAMRRPISDVAARDFATSFYADFTAMPLSRAVARARNLLLGSDESSFEFATPALFSSLEGDDESADRIAMAVPVAVAAPVAAPTPANAPPTPSRARSWRAMAITAAVVVLALVVGLWLGRDAFHSERGASENTMAAIPTDMMGDGEDMAPAGALLPAPTATMTSENTMAAFPTDMMGDDEDMEPAGARPRAPSAAMTVDRASRPSYAARRAYRSRRHAAARPVSTRPYTPVEATLGAILGSGSGRGMASLRRGMTAEVRSTPPPPPPPPEAIVPPPVPVLRSMVLPAMPNAGSGTMAEYLGAPGGSPCGDYGVRFLLTATRDAGFAPFVRTARAWHDCRGWTALIASGAAWDAPDLVAARTDMRWSLRRAALDLAAAGIPEAQVEERAGPLPMFDPDRADAELIPALAAATPPEWPALRADGTVADPVPSTLAAAWVKAADTAMLVAQVRTWSFATGGLADPAPSLARITHAFADRPAALAADPVGRTEDRATPPPLIDVRFRFAADVSTLLGWSIGAAHLDQPARDWLARYAAAVSRAAADGRLHDRWRILVEGHSVRGATEYDRRRDALAATSEAQIALEAAGVTSDNIATLSCGSDRRALLPPGTDRAVDLSLLPSDIAAPDIACGWNRADSFVPPPSPPPSSPAPALAPVIHAP